ncbi:MAG: DUF1178 family protein, partial [Salaquimonas sp.]
MIKYSLGCEKEHEFEGWFASSDEFARLQKGDLLDCPVCGSSKIHKRLMAPSVKTTKGKELALAPSQNYDLSQPAKEIVEPPRVPLAATPNIPDLPPEVQIEIVEQLRQIRKKVIASAENVGEKFSEEARKMHYGEK